MAEWQDEEVSKLISLYEQRPCLHDVSLSDYHNKTKKRHAEEEVAALLEKAGKCQTMLLIRYQGRSTPFAFGYRGRRGRGLGEGMG